MSLLLYAVRPWGERVVSKVPPMKSPVRPESTLLAFPSREETFASVRRQKRFDMVVVGGGIHGAVAAWLAALHGLSVILIEREDYGEGYSGFAPPVLDVGELFDGWEQLRCAKERARLLHDWQLVAPHLLRPQEVTHYHTSPRPSDRLLRLMNRSKLTGGPLSQLDNYYRARHPLTVADLSKLHIESLIMARQEGALCMNHTEVVGIQPKKSRAVSVTFRDRLLEAEYQVQCGVVVNCAGRDANTLGRVSGEDRSLRFVWDMSAVFTDAWHREVTVLHSRGTEVACAMAGDDGGTLLHVFGDESTPDLFSDEYSCRTRAAELAAQLGFSGVCSIVSAPRLVRRNGKRNPPFLRPQFRSRGALYRLEGFNPLWARRNALELLTSVLRAADRTTMPKLSSLRLYPGAASLPEVREQFRAGAMRYKIPESLIEGTLARLGARVRYFLENPEFFSPLGDARLVGEVVLALYQEQAETVEDLVVRRLCCERELVTDALFRQELHSILVSLWGEERAAPLAQGPTQSDVA